MSEKNTKEKKQTRNKARDMIADYYRTNKAYDEENRRRQDEEGVRSKGLRNLNTTEKALVAIIVLGLIGIVVRYVIL
ncbi:MAG: hypothetical protein V8Q42_07335 [Anaerovoracaceae bacterium]|jgi:hypothetical protein